MTERRPHWDDQLVTAVIHEIGALRPSTHSIRHRLNRERAGR